MFDNHREWSIYHWMHAAIYNILECDQYEQQHIGRVASEPQSAHTQDTAPDTLAYTILPLLAAA